MSVATRHLDGGHNPTPGVFLLGSPVSQTGLLHNNTQSKCFTLPCPRSPRVGGDGCFNLCILTAQRTTDVQPHPSPPTHSTLEQLE